MCLNSDIIIGYPARQFDNLSYLPHMKSIISPPIELMMVLTYSIALSAVKILRGHCICFEAMNTIQVNSNEKFEVIREACRRLLTSENAILEYLEGAAGEFDLAVLISGSDVL